MKTIPECLIQAKTIKHLKNTIVVQDIVCIITCASESKESSLEYLKSKHQVLDLNETKKIVILDKLNKNDHVLKHVKNHNVKLQTEEIKINILEVASELAGIDTCMEICDQSNVEENEKDWERVYVRTPEGINYTEKAQDVFNRLYDFYYDFLLKHSTK